MTQENKMAERRIGIIGGSGLYQMDGFEAEEKVKLDTPFGQPSDEYVIGTLEGKPVVFLPRHGIGHHITAPKVNYRANIYGMKQLGAEYILSVSAVGSLKEEYHPGHIVVVDQFIDRTRQRQATFFEKSAVHILFAEPICKILSGLVYESAKAVGANVHHGGSYVCIEGPQLSTKAESHIYRSWNADVVGMTNLTEAKLAREAEICYTTIAMITDYDCWHETEEVFSAEKIVETFNQNVKVAQNVLKESVRNLDLSQHDCSCQHALDGALLSAKDVVTEEEKAYLGIVGARLF